MKPNHTVVARFDGRMLHFTTSLFERLLKTTLGHLFIYTSLQKPRSRACNTESKCEVTNFCIRWPVVKTAISFLWLYGVKSVCNVDSGTITYCHITIAFLDLSLINQLIIFSFVISISISFIACRKITFCCDVKHKFLDESRQARRRLGLRLQFIHSWLSQGTIAVKINVLVCPFGNILNSIPSMASWEWR